MIGCSSCGETVTVCIRRSVSALSQFWAHNHALSWPAVLFLFCLPFAIRHIREYGGTRPRLTLGIRAPCPQYTCKRLEKQFQLAQSRAGWMSRMGSYLGMTYEAIMSPVHAGWRHLRSWVG